MKVTATVLLCATLLPMAAVADSNLDSREQRTLKLVGADIAKQLALEAPAAASEMSAKQADALSATPDAAHDPANSVDRDAKVPQRESPFRATRPNPTR